jgi:FAD/FMN-containing dehydrogenase
MSSSPAARPRLVPVTSATPPLPLDHLEPVSAWGGSSRVLSWVYRPTTAGGIEEAFALARARGLSVGLRGAGQSYGDAALNAENVCLDLSRMTRILAWDPSTGVITVEPGVTIRQLWQYTLEDGWWPSIVPGTMFVSLGGAAAMNVHGKNAFKAGTLGEHIHGFELLLPTGERRTCSRTENAELFHAAIGGFGMLGCITSITFSMTRVHSGLLDVEAIPTRTLDEMLDVFEQRHATADYLVGWVDGFGTGTSLGRGLIHQANYLAAGVDRQPAQTLRTAHQELPPTLFGVFPKALMWRAMRPLMHPPGVRLVNAAKYHLSARQGRHHYRDSHVGFAFLFDYIPEWKRAYGPGGMIEFQSFVPAAEASRVFGAQLVRAQRAGIVPYLGVLKRHRTDPFLLSYGVDGYSLAMHFQVTAANRARLWALTQDMGTVAHEAGGRFYFAKDATFTRQTLADYLAAERFQQFRALKAACDPTSLLQTELYRRLFGTD